MSIQRRKKELTNIRERAFDLFARDENDNIVLSRRLGVSSSTVRLWRKEWQKVLKRKTVLNGNAVDYLIIGADSSQFQNKGGSRR